MILDRYSIRKQVLTKPSFFLVNSATLSTQMYQKNSENQSSSYSGSGWAPDLGRTQELPPEEVLPAVEKEKLRQLSTLVPRPARQALMENSQEIQEALDRVTPDRPSDIELWIQSYRYIGVSAWLPDDFRPTDEDDQAADEIFHERQEELRRQVVFELMKYLPAWIIPQGEKDTIIMDANQQTLFILEGFCAYILPQVIVNFFDQYGIRASEDDLEYWTRNLAVLSVGVESKDGQMKATITESEAGEKIITVGQYLSATPEGVINPALTPGLAIKNIRRDELSIKESQIPLLVQKEDTVPGQLTEHLVMSNDRKGLGVQNEAYVANSKNVISHMDFLYLIRQQKLQDRFDTEVWQDFASSQDWTKHIEAGTYFPLSYFVDQLSREQLSYLKSGEEVHIQELDSVVLPYRVVVGTDVSGMTRITKSLSEALDNAQDNKALEAELNELKSGADQLFQQWQLYTMSILKGRGLPLNEIAGDGAKAICTTQQHISFSEMIEISALLAESWVKLVSLAQRDEQSSLGKVARWLQQIETYPPEVLRHPGEIFVKTSLNVTNIDVNMTNIGGNFYSLLKEETSAEELFDWTKDFREHIRGAQVEILSVLNTSVWTGLVNEMAADVLNPDEELLRKYAGMGGEQEMAVLQWTVGNQRRLFVVRVPEPGSEVYLPNDVEDLTEQLQEAFGKLQSRNPREY